MNKVQVITELDKLSVNFVREQYVYAWIICPFSLKNMNVLPPENMCVQGTSIGIADGNLR